MHRLCGRILAACVLAAVLPLTTHAQANVNPDISVIPRFVITSNDGERLAQGVRKFSQPDLQFQELELAIQSYLNPFARADVILTLPGPDIETSKLGIEELYATVVRGLPLDLNLRLGKYRAEFGKMNMIHPHAWPFISQPLMENRFLGEEGLNDLGISASLLIPTGEVYSKLTVDLLRGHAIGSAAGLPDTSGAKPTYAVSSRVSSFFTLSDESDLEAGVSLLTGIHDPYYRDRFWYGNVDAKYKYRPSAYTSLTLQGEWLLNTRRSLQTAGGVFFRNAVGDLERRTITSGGAYLYADLQFFKQYSIGVRYDWTQTPYSADERSTGGAIFAGYYPVEETLGVRFEYQYVRTTVPTLTQSVNTLALQVLFSLGPHKAHPF